MEAAQALLPASRLVNQHDWAQILRFMAKPEGYIDTDPEASTYLRIMQALQQSSHPLDHQLREYLRWYVANAVYGPR